MSAAPDVTPVPVKPRTAARLAAVQALYQMDLAGTGLNDIIDEWQRVRFNPDAAQEEDGEPDDVAAPRNVDRVFFADILRAVLRLQREIDPMIDEQLAIGWRLVRVDAILRAILRAGSAELLDRRDVPGRVVINEYINVARSFFSDDEPRVVNGVLDKIARKLRPQEFDGAGHG